MIIILAIVAIIMWINTGILIDRQINDITNSKACVETTLIAAFMGPVLLLVLWWIK
jgi:hypothetical protein